MRSLLHAAATAVALLAAAALAAPGAQAAQPITVVATKHVSARVTDYSLRSTALPAPTPLRVIVPDGYDPKAARRYPVMYLLHGGAGSYTNWTSTVLAEAKGLKVIFVLPDGGLGGWYTNWFKAGTKGKPAWQTYHVDQLVPWIDAHYRTIAARHGRAIGGLSMGGFGAWSYAAQHPDVFAGAFSYSGAIDTNYGGNTTARFLGAISALSGGRLDSLWGMRDQQEIRWRGSNPWDLAANLSNTSLTIRTGNGTAAGPLLPGVPKHTDLFEIAVHAMSVDMDKRLKTLKVPHVFQDYGDGYHAWVYWNRDFKLDVPRLAALFAHPKPDVPPSFTYRSIQPSYSVYDWRVAIRRRALEFSQLGDAGVRGFTLSGSGTATVTTPARYRARSVHTVTLTSGARTTRRVARATAAGRLELSVPLGTANVRQAYTSGAKTRVYTTRVTIAP